MEPDGKDVTQDVRWRLDVIDARLDCPRAKSGKFPRSRTTMVKSWCQTTFQLASWVLLKNVALTAKQFFPRTVSARTRTGADPANSRTIGTESRFLAAYVVALR